MTALLDEAVLLGIIRSTTPSTGRPDQESKYEKFHHEAATTLQAQVKNKFLFLVLSSIHYSFFFFDVLLFRKALLFKKKIPRQTQIYQDVKEN